MLAELVVSVCPHSLAGLSPAAWEQGQGVGAGAEPWSRVVGWAAPEREIHTTKIRVNKIKKTLKLLTVVCAQVSCLVGSPWHPSMTRGAGVS